MNNGIKLVSDLNKPGAQQPASLLLLLNARPLNLGAKSSFFPRACCCFFLQKQANLICFAAAEKGGREVARDCVVAETRRARTHQPACKQKSHGNVYLQERLGHFWQRQEELGAAEVARLSSRARGNNVF